MSGRRTVVTRVVGDPAGAPPGAALRRAAGRFGTPLFVTSIPSLEAASAELAAAFPDPWLRAFSLKANDVPAIVARLGALGLGANVVSSGEWAAARRAGMPNARVTLEGIGKTTADLRAAIRAAAGGDPLRWVAVESPEELAELASLANQAGLGLRGRPPVEVLLRLNPDVAPETHAGLAVGRSTAKFGMTETELTAAVAAVSAVRGVRVRGVHLHVGSQLGAVDAFRDAVRRGLALVALVRASDGRFDTLDVGGGFPAGPPDVVPAPARFAREAAALLETVAPDRRPRRLAVEPGRFLVARAGWLVGRVLHVRERSRGLRVVVLDTGLTELIRPALYGARHPIVALTSMGRAVSEDDAVASTPTRVDGPVCESTDTLGSHDLPPLRRGDLVAIGDAGAYAASMAMTYNGRPAAAQVLLERDGTFTLGRRRGSLRGAR